MSRALSKEYVTKVESLQECFQWQLHIESGRHWEHSRNLYTVLTDILATFHSVNGLLIKGSTKKYKEKTYENWYVILHLYFYLKVTLQQMLIKGKHVHTMLKQMQSKTVSFFKWSFFFFFSSLDNNSRKLYFQQFVK